MEEKATFEFDPVEIGGDSRFSRFLASVDWRQTMVVDWDAAETWEEGQFLGGNGPRHTMPFEAHNGSVEIDDDVVLMAVESTIDEFKRGAQWIEVEWRRGEANVNVRHQTPDRTLETLKASVVKGNPD